jgi:hypothetical protein
MLQLGGLHEKHAVKLKLKLNLRPAVSRPVCLGVRRPSGTRDQFFFLLEISFRKLRLCYFVAHSLTRGWVCNLLAQLLLGLARAVTLRSKSRRTHGHILLSHLRLSKPRGPGSLTYISQEQGGPVIPPGTGLACRSKSKSHYDRQSVGQSVLVSGDHLGPATNFSCSSTFSFRQLRFIIL